VRVAEVKVFDVCLSRRNAFSGRADARAPSLAPLRSGVPRVPRVQRFPSRRGGASPARGKPLCATAVVYRPGGGRPGPLGAWSGRRPRSRASRRKDRLPHVRMCCIHPPTTRRRLAARRAGNGEGGFESRRNVRSQGGTCHLGARLRTDAHKAHGKKEAYLTTKARSGDPARDRVPSAELALVDRWDSWTGLTDRRRSNRHLTFVSRSFVDSPLLQ
jgi:hypothetical protein